MNRSDIIATATLNNGKKVVVEPSYSQGKCRYRYITEREIRLNTLEPEKKHVWLETGIDSTVSEGMLKLFSVIDFTPVVFNRIKDI